MKFHDQKCNLDAMLKWMINNDQRHFACWGHPISQTASIHMPVIQPLDVASTSQHNDIWCGDGGDGSMPMRFVETQKCDQVSANMENHGKPMKIITEAGAPSVCRTWFREWQEHFRIAECWIIESNGDSARDWEQLKAYQCDNDQWSCETSWNNKIGREMKSLQCHSTCDHMWLHQTTLQGTARCHLNGILDGHCVGASDLGQRSWRGLGKSGEKNKVSLCLIWWLMSENAKVTKCCASSACARMH